MYRSYKELGQTDEEKELDYQNNGYKYEIIQNNSHKQNIVQNNLIVCDYIFGTWCAPCKNFRTTYAKMAEGYNKQGLLWLCAEDYEILNPKCEVVPTFLFYLRGQLVKTIVGADVIKIEEQLNNMLNEVNRNSRPQLYDNNKPNLGTNPNPKNKFQNFHGTGSFR